jgi:hypothetical protein
MDTRSNSVGNLVRDEGAMKAMGRLLALMFGQPTRSVAGMGIDEEGGT